MKFYYAKPVLSMIILKMYYSVCLVLLPVSTAPFSPPRKMSLGVCARSPLIYIRPGNLAARTTYMPLKDNPRHPLKQVSLEITAVPFKCRLLLAAGEARFEQGVEARSGQGSPPLCFAKRSSGESDAADPSEALPRRGKASVPARTRLDSR